MSQGSDNSTEDIDDLLDEIPNIRRKNVMGSFNMQDPIRPQGRSNSISVHEESKSFQQPSAMHQTSSPHHQSMSQSPDPNPGKGSFLNRTYSNAGPPNQAGKKPNKDDNGDSDDPLSRVSSTSKNVKQGSKQDPSFRGKRMTLTSMDQIVEEGSKPKIEKTERKTALPKTDLNSLVKGDYVDGGTKQPSKSINKHAQSFAVGSSQQYNKFALQSSKLLTNKIAPARKRSYKDCEVEIFKVIQKDSGFLFDMTLYKDEVNMVKKNNQKILIQNYLEMKDIKSDDITMYLRRARSQTVEFDQAQIEAESRRLKQLQQQELEGSSPDDELVDPATRALIEGFDPDQLDGSMMDDDEKGEPADSIPQQNRSEDNYLENVFLKSIFKTKERKQYYHKKVTKSAPIDLKSRHLASLRRGSSARTNGSSETISKPKSRNDLNSGAEDKKEKEEIKEQEEPQNEAHSHPDEEEDDEKSYRTIRILTRNDIGNISTIFKPLANTNRETITEEVQPVVPKATTFDKEKIIEALKKSKVKKARRSTTLQHHSELVVPEDPLDELDKKDIISLKKDVDANQFSKFLMVTKNPLASEYNLRTIDDSMCEGITKSLYKDKKKFEASIMKFAPPKYTFVGTTNSTIQVFDKKEVLIKTIQYKDGPKQTITAMDYSYELEGYPILVVGFSGGHISVYDLNSFSQIKSINNVQTCKITDIKIITTEPLSFVSADCDGELYYITVEKKLWYYEKSSTLLKKFNNNFAISLNTLRHDMRVINSKTLEEEDFLRRIVAIATLDKVLISSVSDKGEFELKWSFNKPNLVIDESLPSISWGNGMYGDNVKRTLLAIGWGNVIYLIGFKSEYYKSSCKLEGYMKFKEKIQYIGFVAESMIMILDIMNKISFVNTREFKEISKLPGLETGGSLSPKKQKSDKNTKDEAKSSAEQSDQPEQQKEEEKEKEEGEEEEQPGTILQSSLKCHLLQKLSFTDRKRNVRTLVGASINAVWESHEIMVMAEEGFKKIKYLSAYEYLDKLIQDGAWLKFLTIGLEVFKGNIPELYGIPKKEKDKIDVLFPFFRQKIKSAFEGGKLKGVNQSYVREFLLAMFDFLTEIQDFDYLFYVAYKEVEKLEQLPLFYELLEPFIRLNRIKFVPDEILRNIIRYFHEQNKSDVMQQLILNLNLKKQDSFILLHLCLEFNLYSTLVHICSQIDDNFVTPFVKLLGDYKLAKRAHKDEESLVFGYRCLWYLRLCIKKKLVTGQGFESEVRWKEIIKQMLQMIFEKENLEILFEIDGEITTILVLSFFQGSLAMFLEENYGDIQIGPVTEGNKDDLHWQIYTVVKEILTNPKPEKKIIFNKYSGFFHGKLANLLRYSFLDRDICVEYVKMFINQPTMLTERLILMWEKSSLEDKNLSTAEIKEHFEGLNSSWVPEQRISMMLDVLRYCQFSMNYATVEELTRRARQYNMIEIECYLLSMNHLYKECFALYLSHRASAEYKAKVLDWTKEVLTTYSDSKDKSSTEKKAIEGLKEAFIEKVRFLMVMNQDKTKELILYYFTGQMLQILVRLSNPKVQIELIERYFKRVDDERLLDENILVLEVQLLSEMDKANQKKIKPRLVSTNRYPTDKCLKIVKTKKIKDAWAYLEIKSGNLQDGLDICFDDFKDKIKKFRSKNTFSYAGKRNKIMAKIRDMVDYLTQFQASDQLWFKILINSFNLLEETLAMKESDQLQYNQYLLLKEEIVDILLENILMTFNSKEVLKTVDDLYESLPQKLKRKLLIRIMEHNNHEEFILHYSQKLQVEDYMSTLNSLLIVNQERGVVGKDYCLTCNKKIEPNQFALWFGCNHMFHSSEECCPEGYCPICKYSAENLAHPIILSKSVNPKLLKTGIHAKQGSNKAPKPLPAEDDSRSRAVTRTANAIKNEYVNKKIKAMDIYDNYSQRKRNYNFKFAEKYVA